MKQPRVALETQFALSRPTGLGVYARRLAAALGARGDLDVVELCEPGLDVWRFDRRLFWDQVRAPLLARFSGADVVHFTGGTLPWRTPHPVVLTLHDLVWLRGANRGRAYVRWYFGRLQPWLARRADALVVDSEAARTDVADGLGIDPARIAVAGVGVEEAFFEIERNPTAEPFVLAVGTIEGRKDLATAVRALARLPDMRLVAAGAATRYADEVLALAHSLGVAGRLELRGYVDDASLRELYATALALVFPSRYEGFGLPPLQALACALPVAAARTPVTREVLGTSAWFFEPGDDRELAEAIERIASGGAEVDARLRDGVARARSFTWERVAEKMASVYRSVLSQSLNRQPT